MSWAWAWAVRLPSARSARQVSPADLSGPGAVPAVCALGSAGAGSACSSVAPAESRQQVSLGLWGQLFKNQIKLLSLWLFCTTIRRSSAFGSMTNTVRGIKKPPSPPGLSIALIPGCQLTPFPAPRGREAVPNRPFPSWERSCPGRSGSHGATVPYQAADLPRAQVTF